jgi:hypothetical protein
LTDDGKFLTWAQDSMNGVGAGRVSDLGACTTTPTGAGVWNWAVVGHRGFVDLAAYAGGFGTLRSIAVGGAGVGAPATVQVSAEGVYSAPRPTQRHIVYTMASAGGTVDGLYVIANPL